MTTDLELATGRSRAYELFGRLLRLGVKPSDVPVLDALPELSQALEPWRQSGALDLDGLAAAHHQVFGFNVFAIESVFASGDAQPGGEVSTEALDDYRRVGFEASSTDTAPDHIGVELEALAFLCGAEADAWEDARPDEAERMQQAQARVLDRRVLPWLPALVLAIHREKDAFSSRLIDLVVELVSHHRSSLPVAARPAPNSEATTLDDLLAREQTGLRDIAELLLSPSRSGLYLSQSEIARLGRAEQLPKGFGGRQTVFHNLLRSAVDYDTLPAVIARLEEHCDGALDFYRTFSAGHSAAVGDFAALWQARVEATRASLGRIAEAARDPG